MSELEESMEYPANRIIDPEAAAELVRPCNAPAPAVVNGAGYVGCQMVIGHEGPHSVTIKWDRV